MDNREATTLLERELDTWRRQSYAELVQRIDQGPHVAESAGYQIEVEFLWDRPRAGNVRVVGSNDDGGLRAFAPLTRSFIKSPNGAFVGE